MKRWATAISAGCTPVLTLCLFGPFDVYSGNAGEFSTGFFAALRSLAPPALAAAGLFSTLPLLLGRRGFELSVSLLFGLSILLYLQGKILVWDYGQFDGTAVAWEHYRWRSVIDMLLWVAGGIAVLRYRGRIARWGVGIAGLLLFAQVATAAVALFRDPDIKFGPTAPGRLNLIHRYSEEKNVLAIVLDGFPATAFEQILQERQELTEILDGFTYFRNTTSPFASTRPAIPAILSGQLYDNSIPGRDFLARVLPRDSIPSVLHGEGYRVDVVTYGRYCKDLRVSACAELLPYIAHDPVRIERVSLLQLMDISLFRQAPQPVKRILYSDQDWLLASLFEERKGPWHHVQTIEFVEALEANARLGASTPTFKFFHLLIPHGPVRLDAECRHSTKYREISRDGYVEQSRCALRLLHRMLDVFKKLGIHDESMIFVLTDHGLNIDWGQGRKEWDYPWPGSALSLLLVKPFGTRGRLQISEAPATVADLPRTVATSLDIDHEFPGRHLFDLEDGERRRRVHRYYKPSKAHWGQPYIRGMLEYVIDGHAWDVDAWKEGDLLWPKRPSRTTE